MEDEKRITKISINSSGHTYFCDHHIKYKVLGLGRGKGCSTLAIRGSKSIYLIANLMILYLEGSYEKMERFI